ncbi:MAG: dynamin family protein [Rothia sp. (in: high G+C Gram-positive bacteria)]|nr:dynamin family protein [Rothia sp. (in: high G+C Gram-positive bacteria)]
MEEQTTQLTANTPESIQDLQIMQTARQTIASVGLPLDTADAAENRQLITRTLTQLDDYVLPRLASLDAPLTVVVGGSTGAGKSTLVNTLLGEPITRSGAIRPTTRQPVLLHRPEDIDTLDTAHLLPHLERIKFEGKGQLIGADYGKVDQLITVETESIPAGIALIDAPDVDSVSEDNRRLAQQLLQSADLWLFVTTANRYADAVPWELLHEAARRDITISVILNRVPEGAEDEIEDDLRRMLHEAGIDPALLLTVTEQETDERGLLPAVALTPLVFWLRELGANTAERSRIARQTLEGSVRSVEERVRSIASAQQSQLESENRLRQDVDRSYRRASETIIDSTQDGALLRGEVLSRWQDFVGTGEFFRGLETGIGRLRDKVASFFKGQPSQAVEVEQALEVGLHAVIVEEAARAAETVQRLWLEERAGRALLGDFDVRRLDEDFPARVAEGIRDWQSDVMAMISQEGADKRQRARFMSLGVNAAAVVLMVAVFSMTGGLTGLEVGIAGGSGVVGTKLLEAVFGEDAVRRMALGARKNLETRIEQMLQDHAAVFYDKLNALDFGPSLELLERSAQDVHHTATALKGNR